VQDIMHKTGTCIYLDATTTVLLSELENTSNGGGPKAMQWAQGAQ